MTDREKKELIEAEETILQLFFDAYERAMKYTKGNINLSLRMAAMLVSAMVHDQTESKSFQLMSRNNRDYISCRNPAATKQQEAGWNRMVRDLEHRKAKENHRKEVKTNGRNA